MTLEPGDLTRHRHARRIGPDASGIGGPRRIEGLGALEKPGRKAVKWVRSIGRHAGVVGPWESCC